jgi:nucleoside phosphorylase
MNLNADVLFVTATKVESKAIFDVFRSVNGHTPEPIPIGDRIYHNLGIINETNVFMVQSEMGTGGLGASLMTVQKGIFALSPSAVIMTGIAFGINAEKQSIGDVLVSQQLLLYELQRVSTEQGKLQLIPRGDQPHASPWLFDRFRSADLYWDETKPKVRFGLILSGEKLVDNIDFREQLCEFAPEAIGGEMEGAGLYVACQDAKVDWILVKSICDWADGKKSQYKDEQQLLAANNAANFVLHVLQQAPLKREGRRLEPNASKLLDNKTNTAQVTILLNKDTHEFTSEEQASFIFALSRIVNVAPDQIQILHVVQGSLLLTVEMPEEAAKVLRALYLQKTPAFQSLEIAKVELRQPSKIAKAKSKISIGRFVVDWIVLQHAEYRQGKIKFTYNNELTPLPQDLEQMKTNLINQQIAYPTFINTQICKLLDFEVGELLLTESKTEPFLRILLGPTDYFSFLVTNRNVGNLVRDSYLNSVDITESPVPEFANPFSIIVNLVTKDGFLIIRKHIDKSDYIRGKLSTSIKELMNPRIDMDTDQVPDPNRTAIRGVKEEMGIDLHTRDINYTTFGIQPDVCDYSLIGWSLLKENRKEIESINNSLVIDKWESKLLFVPCKPDSIAKLVYRHWDRWYSVDLASVILCLIQVGYSDTDIITAFERRALTD